MRIIIDTKTIINSPEEDNYQEKTCTFLLDNHFELVRKIINLSTEICHKDINQRDIIETGQKLIKHMISVHFIALEIINSYPQSREAKTLFDLYSCPARAKIIISKEMENLSSLYRQTSSRDINKNKKKLLQAVYSIILTAATNLQEYQLVLKEMR